MVFIRLGAFIYMYIFVLGIKSKANMFMGIWLPFYLSSTHTSCVWNKKELVYWGAFQWPTSPWHFSVQVTGGLHQLHCTELSLSCIRFPRGLWTNGSSTLTRILNNSAYHPHSQSPAVSIGTLLQPLKEGLLIRVCVCSFGWKGFALVASLLVTNGKASHAID